MRAGDCIYVYSTHRININRLLPFRKNLYRKLALYEISELLYIVMLVIPYTFSIYNF